MIYRQLGKTGFNVSRLCFGTLTISPLQANFTINAGASLIRDALERGVNFLDTAEIYDNYRYIKSALSGFSGRVFVASKSYAYTEQMMRESVDKARLEMGVDVVDLFLLHEQESVLTLRGHRPALEYLMEAKIRGIVGAIGVSTHFVQVVEAVSMMSEIDVIHPIINISGLGIRGGGVDDMLAAIHTAHSAGKGIYAMKALGGGNLHGDAQTALEFVRDISYIDSVAVGVKNRAELDMNIHVMSGIPVPDELRARAVGEKKRLLIDQWCRGCGECVRACQFGALSLVEGKAQVNPSLCTLCAYCAAACPNFFIKMV